MSTNTSKTIIITGATGGIGAPIAKALAQPDTQLILTSTNIEALEKLQAEVSSSCPETTVHKVDLSDLGEVESFCRMIDSAHREIDWIIHSAGLIDEGEQSGVPDRTRLEKTYTVNTLAPIHLTQLLQNKITVTGGVIALTSTAALWGNPGYPLYASSKAALQIYSKALGKQFADSGRRAIAVCPGATNTPMREKVAGDADQHQSPDVIAEYIQDVIDNANDANNGDIVVIQDGMAKKHELG